MGKSRTSRTGITKKRKKIKPLDERLPNDHGEWLELAIHTTERSIRYPNNSDAYLVEQANRLKSELELWKRSK